MASQGDPRVLFAMNLVLSAAFSTAVVWGLSFIGLMTFEWGTVAVGTAALFAVTYLAVMR